jgi:hypothetical protein
MVIPLPVSDPSILPLFRSLFGRGNIAQPTLINQGPSLTLLSSIEWHVDQGLIATMVEAPLEMQKSLTIPQDHLAACQAGNIPTAGNAAANTVNLLDLTGANVAPKPLPAGFTPRGIVAMTFSCVAALLGLAVITWYIPFLNL